MPIGEVCNREVVVASPGLSVSEAARLMRRLHVGDIVVVEEKGGGRVPVGIVTDRDIVLGVVAMGLDPSVLTVGDIMGAELVCTRERDGVFDTIQLMRGKGVRRAPVVNEAGGLEGIITVDDLLQLLAEEMNELSRLVEREIAREGQTRK